MMRADSLDLQIRDRTDCLHTVREIEDPGFVGGDRTVAALHRSAKNNHPVVIRVVDRFVVLAPRWIVRGRKLPPVAVTCSEDRAYAAAGDIAGEVGVVHQAVGPETPVDHHSIAHWIVYAGMVRGRNVLWHEPPICPV